MKYQTFISASELHQNLDDPNLVIVDCRFSLDDTELGRSLYYESHIPGAYYAHVDAELSSEIIPGTSGRHPLPDPADFARLCDSWGVTPESQIVAYDDAGGKIAGRLWWLMRWFGHNQVAVLDQGIQDWKAAGFETTAEVPAKKEGNFIPDMQSELAFKPEDIIDNFDTKRFLLVDSRTTERYAGINEPIDPIAGHIPDAVNRPFPENLTEDLRILPPEQLRKRFEDLLSDRTPDEIVFYCGSGITGAHNVLAFLHAGLGEARLYPGSWSEWIADPQRPIITAK